MPTVKTYAKKQATRAGKYVKKRYFKGKGYSNPKVSTIARDVMRLKQIINSEKQNAETQITTEYDLAQFNGVSTPGYRLIDCMPTISQGVGEDNRKGDSIKVCSWVLQMQTYNNSELSLTDYDYKFLVIQQPLNPTGATITTVDQFLETNSFSLVRDYYSNRNYQHYKDFRVLGMIKGRLKAQDTATTSNSSSSNQHTLARKADFHIRYDKGTNTILNNPIYLLALCDDGDRNTSNKMFFKFSFKVFYYDN